MDESPNINGYSFSWTQPYNVSMNPAYDTHLRVCQELLLLDSIDLRVQNMQSYPDAERILSKLKGDAQ